jgi:hypothetical protein
MWGLVVGAVTGSGLFLLGTILAVFAAGRRSAPDSIPWQDTIGLLLLLFGITLFYFALGLVLVGAPAWWLLHRLGRRTLLDAVIAGAALSSSTYLSLVLLGVVPLIFGPGPQYFAASVIGTVVVLMLLVNAIWVAVSGALAGFVIWGIAYRPAN